MPQRRLMMVLLVAIPLLLVSACARPSEPTAETATVTSRHEVESFVQEAVDFAHENGKAKALEEFTSPNGRFHRGELYVFAYDFDGNVLAHGGNPQLVGQNLMALEDPTGAAVVRAFVELAKAGAGWAGYVWPNPDHDNAEEPKYGYVMKVDDTWWLGAGTYAKAA